MRILLAHYGYIQNNPPIISLIENLLHNGHFVSVVCLDEVPAKIRGSERLVCADCILEPGPNSEHSVIDKIRCRRTWKSAVRRYIDAADIVWVTSTKTVVILGRELLKYRYILEVLELDKWCPYPGLDHLKFPIEKYAKSAWKVVVPELNRAYIQKAWWRLENLPCVLPNKPYSIEIGSISDAEQEQLKRMRSETRKIILYLGIFVNDRNFEAFADAVEALNDTYCLYMVGRVEDRYKKEFDMLLRNHPSILYCGYYQSPAHLAFLRHAYMGLLNYVPEVPESGGLVYRSELNAMYCAPNKIFEYAAFGVPMIGTDVPGLRQPFRQYGMGVCCEKLTANAIVEAIRAVEERHDEMASNCLRFYKSVDLDAVVQGILDKEP